MTKFERIGVNYQLEATTIKEATHSLKISCDICCHKMRACFNDCDHCAIQQYHNMIVADMADKVSVDN